MTIKSQIVSGPRSRLATAIMSTMAHAGSFTDMLIHEGHPILLKSAKGNVSIADLGLPGGDMIVEASDIKHFFTYYVESTPGSVRSGDYWESEIIPVLSNQQAVNRSVSTPGAQYLRFSLICHQRGKLAMVVRVTTPPPELDMVGLTPQIVNRIKTKPRGLLIITGPTASGKTSTALSILNWLNHNRPGHLLTVEDPIEFPLVKDKCVITQREVGVDVTSFGQGLRDAMRLSPDAILAGEVRDKDTAEMAVMGGESGALMIVTTHGSSVTGTMRKILTMTGDQSSAMREVMAGCLIGVVRQELVPVADKSGYLMVCDSLHMTSEVRESVEKGDWSTLDKMTDNAAMPSPNFVPMSTQLRYLAGKNLINKDVMDELGVKPISSIDE
jgi:twitching motility protein PilT